MVWNIPLGAGQLFWLCLQQNFQCSPTDYGALWETAKALTLCKNCTAATKTLVRYLHCFFHRYKPPLWRKLALSYQKQKLLLGLWSVDCSHVEYALLHKQEFFLQNNQVFVFLTTQKQTNWNTQTSKPKQGYSKLEYSCKRKSLLSAQGSLITSF